MEFKYIRGKDVFEAKGKRGDYTLFKQSFPLSNYELRLERPQSKDLQGSPSLFRPYLSWVFYNPKQAKYFANAYDDKSNGLA